MDEEIPFIFWGEPSQCLRPSGIWLTKLSNEHQTQLAAIPANPEGEIIVDPALARAVAVAHDVFITAPENAIFCLRGLLPDAPLPFGLSHAHRLDHP